MKDSEKKPRIRFNEFEGDWESYKLGEISKEITRNDPNSLAPIMMITANNGFIKQSERYAYNNAGESLNKYILLQKGELAYNHGASKLRPYGSCFALTTVDEARIPFVYHCFSAFPNNPEFVSEELNGKDVENQLRKIVSSGARMDGLLNISFEEYKTLSVFIPDTDEQRDIAEFIHQLEDFINLQQKKYTQLVNMKSSLLEKMFPHDGAKVPEIRFDGYTGDWTEEKLGRISNLLTGYPFESKYFSNSGIRLIRGVNVKRGYLDMSSDLCEYWPTSTGLDEYLLQQGDIVIQMDGAMIGRSYAMINNDDLPSLLVQRVTRVRTDGELSAYLYYCIQKGFLNYILGLKTETAVPHLSLKDIANYTIKVPQDEKEAICIGNFFQQMDKGITCLQQQIDQLKNIKQSFLDKMFVS